MRTLIDFEEIAVFLGQGVDFVLFCGIGYKNFGIGILTESAFGFAFLV